MAIRPSRESEPAGAEPLVVARIGDRCDGMPGAHDLNRFRFVWSERDTGLITLTH